MKRCRLCGKQKMSQFLDLGFTPPADLFIVKEQLDEPEIHYPLKVVRCDQCLFIQLSYVVPPGILYRNDYPYESSVTQAGRSHFDSFAESVIDKFDLSKGDLVIDVGSNVGVLLHGFQDRGCKVLGFEPAENIAEIAKKNDILTMPVFFSPDTAKEAVEQHGKAKILTASNVFAHIDDLDAMMTAVDSLLDKDGVFIVEAPYAVHLLDKLEYDTIYHEHLSYLSLIPLVPFFQKCHFELFDVTQVDIHGGSIRLFISRKSEREVSSRVEELLKYEQEHDIHLLETLQNFSKRVEENRDNLVTLLRSLKSEGKRIAAVSAPAKGMTLLNYCKIDSEILEFVTEKSTLKINKYTPGTHLPVLPDSALLTEDIDYALLLAWNFKDEIIKNLSAFREAGGKFIIPIPEPVIV
jgi:hypothetical protein